MLPIYRRFETFRGYFLSAIALLTLTIPVTTPAATIVWSGASGTDTNWSDTANWVGGVVPGGGDDVKFFDLSATTLGKTNSIVDSGFGGYIGSLQLGNTNNSHTILLTSGLTLSVTNGGLLMGTPGDTAASKNLTNAIIGSGATLSVSNLTANIGINQADSTTSPSRANLDLSGLDNFVVSVNRMGIGDGSFPGLPTTQRCGGNLILAKTNSITLAYTDTLANYQTAGKNSAITMSRNPNNNPGIISLLQLGIANTFNVDSMNIGMDKSGNNTTPAHGVLRFNPAFAGQNLMANFYGAGGPGTRVTWWSDGDGNSSASSSNGGGGTNDFSLGTVNAFVNVISLARDANSSSDSWAGPHKGVFIFTNGTVDVNTLIIGNQSLETGTSKTPSLGIFNVAGAGALLKVNTLMTLGNATLAPNFVTNVAGVNTSGNLNIINGTVYANNINVGVNSITNVITLINGTLLVSNTLATNASALFALNISNSTLGLTLNSDGLRRALVQNLNSTGPTNLIQLDTNPVLYSSYPTQVPLVKYTTWNGSNIFGLASVPPWAPGATLVSNSANKSLDLALPYDPRPVITNIAGQPISVPANPDPSNNVTLSIGISPNTVLPLGYQWYLGATPLTDGPTGNGSTNSGSTTDALTILNSQTNDSGNYSVVITNIYGSVTSTVLSLIISTNSVAPHITGPNSPTVIQGNTASLLATVSGKPVPTLQWQLNGTNLMDGPTGNGDIISGSSSSVLMITNAQYPASQGTYSLIASNSAGTATNSGFLTVIVPPTISVEPVSLVVTTAQSASFSVTATGVPAPGYQWLKNNVPITNNASAQTSTLQLNSVTAADIATYSVLVTNTAGTTNSLGATLVVNSPTMAPAAFAPANGATGICYDTPLYLTFNQAPTLRNGGQVRIYNATNSATPVDTLDMSLNQTASGAINFQLRTIGGDNFNSYPVIITGNTAAIYPHLDLLTSNQTYYVTVDDGVFTDSTGAYFVGITNSNTWRFTTKIAGPANPTNVVVAADGTGDFLTVQGAIDSVPVNNTNLTLVNIRNGFYTEILDVKSRNNIDFRGQTRTGTFVGYPNNNNLNSSGAPLRAMIVMNGNDCTFENITLTNTTPHGGSQAEAIDVEATRCALYNMELDSYQDTFLVHSAGKLIYFQDCLIQGDTDFNWGYGTVFYTNCELRCLSPGSHVTQPRSPFGQNGFSFVNCKVTKGGTNVTSADLGRSINTPTTPSEAIFITTLLDDVISGYSSDAGTNFWYSSCSNLTATQLRTNLTFATLLQPTDPTVLLAENATNWLYGWFPLVSPNILGNPAGQNVAGGGTLNLSVSATGLPGPSYQWFKDGNPVSGQTNATLTIPSANANNSGSYSVVVSNILGVLTSSAANVVVSNSAPTLAPIPSTTNNVGFTVNVTPSASDPDSPPQILHFSLVSGPFTTFNTNSGVYTWRPQVTDSGTVNTIQIAVTDNGSPNLSATQSFFVAVNPLTQPTVSAPAYSGGQFSMTVNGQTGPDYEVLASTNLTDWLSLVTNTSPTMPFLFTDPNAASHPLRFYRIVVGPPPR
jgi:pectin methylesterase-like acyl-CoA thioesterase